MNIRMGEKIRTLRKARNVSQEVLAQYLGISFQAVSKWENDTSMPDVALIPAIASFLEVSTDELFDYNRLETEKRVEQICFNAAQYRLSDPAKAQKILQEGLKQYPGNDILLNNLLYTMRTPGKEQEVADLCRALIESTKRDDVRFDALRILAETYRAAGEYELCKQTIEKIPEIYFTKLQLDAMLLEGDDMYESACEQKHLSAEMLLDMMLRLAEYYLGKNEPEKARQELILAKKIAEVMKDDQSTPIYEQNFHEYYGKEALKKIEAMLDNL